jgi:TonB-linked SusC/RagA family outer membrane protein
MNQRLLRCSFVLLLMLFGSITLLAQQRTLTGTIKSQDTKEPLSGVSISIKGSTKATATNDKGEFSIVVPANETVLKISYVGYVYQEITVGSRKTLQLVLQKDNKQLDEVVVVGYGTQKRTHLTGSVATVDMKRIEDFPVGNLSEALRGQIAGVSVSGGFSRPGEPATITIRNPVFYSKDGGSKEPIFVIDDIIRTKADFDLLDATEVESISVLKDAAAAIYGIVGSNGVIVVRTKRGKPGQSTITYSSSYGVADAAYKPKMLSAYQQAQYFNAYSGGSKDWDPTAMAGLSTYYTPDELEYFKTHNYNWLDEAFQKSYSMRQTINISGGSDRATYFAGFTYNNQNSNFPGLGFDRYSFRSSSDIKLATGLKLGLSLSANLSDKKNTFSKIGGESLDNDWKSVVTQSQMFPTHINGLPVWIPGSGTGSNFNTYNFFALHETDNYTSSKGAGVNFQGSLSYEFPFIKGLRANVNFNKNINNSFGKQYGTFYDTYSFQTAGAKNHYLTEDLIRSYSFKNGDRVRLNPSNTNVTQLNTTVNYDRQIGKHQIGVLFGYEQSESFSDGVEGMREGVVPGGLDNQNFAVGTNSSNETISSDGRLAYLGRIDYNYAGKYLLQVQFRADASLRFAPENRWGYFPSASAGWVVSEEKFFGNLSKTVNYLKLRGSVGLMGLDATKPWQWARAYAIQTGKAAIYGGNNNTAMSYAVVADVELANRAVHWDNVDKYNVGIDARFLRNRLSASLDGFLDKRSQMLTFLTSSPSFLIGASLPSENFSKLNNFGFEASLNWKDRISKNWGYSVQANFNWQDDKVLIKDFAVGDRGTFKDPTGRSQDLGFYGYKNLGMFRSQADIDAYVKQYGITKMLGYSVAQLRPGMLYFADVRGPKDASGNYTGPDGVIDDNDQDYLNKHADNHYGLGFNWSVSYKSLSLGVQMGLSWGGVTSVESAARKVGKDVWTNRPVFWSDVWTPENVDAAYPNPFYSQTYDLNSDFWWRSSTTFNINSFNLSYTLPKSLTEKVRFNSARIFLVGTNVLNLKNPFEYKGDSGSFDAFPDLRSFSLGLNVSL